MLLDKLSELIDISYYETETGAFTVTTRSGELLVAADLSRDIQAVSGSGAQLQLELEAAKILPPRSTPQLGGLLKSRDVLIPGYLTSLDDMAATLIAAVNTQHILGSDYNGNDGGNFFTPFVQTVPGSNRGAARSISLAFAIPA
ncbi:MAG: hypothetical protein MZW92_12890 [Comamonadaceae bacterium]|nr:hypothetical protein [Comamonadaceae bacterium]